MSETDIKFFPAEAIKNKYLGGGYITSGILKTRFSVFQSEKSPTGFFVTLPSVKNPDGSWTNQVDFKNRDASMEVSNYVAPLVATLLGGSAPAGVQAPVQQATAPSRVAIQAGASNVGTPF